MLRAVPLWAAGTASFDRQTRSGSQHRPDDMPDRAEWQHEQAYPGGSDRGKRLENEPSVGSRQAHGFGDGCHYSASAVATAPQASILTSPWPAS